MHARGQRRAGGDRRPCTGLEHGAKTLGNPASTTDDQRTAMISRFKAGESISALARDDDVSRVCVMRIVKPASTGAP